MHVALLFEFGTLNGGEHSILTTLDRLPGDVQATAIAPASGRLAATLDNRGIHRVEFDIRDANGSRRPRTELLDDIARIVDQLAPDVLHANSLSMARWTGTLGDRVAHVRRTGHLRDIVKLSAAVIRDLNGNDRLVAVSQATAAFHIERGLDGDKVDVIHNGVDLSRFRPRLRSGTLRVELGLPDDALIALAIGQIGLRKGQDVLAEAAVLLDDPRLHFVLVGERFSEKAESVAFERAIGERFTAAGMADRLHRLGYRDDVAELMNEADLLVHPAKQEPLGRVLLEAAASWLPIIATDVGGTREIVDEDAAWLVPAGSAEALAEAIATALADGFERTNRALTALQVVESRCAADDAAESLVRFWRDVAT